MKKLFHYSFVVQNRMVRLVLVLLCFSYVISCDKPTPPEPDPDTPVSVSSITLNETSIVLSVGDSFSLTTKIAPANATDKTVIWSSSNTEIVSVNNGIVTAVSVGTATVCAQCGSVKAECVVNVTPVEVTSINLNKTNVNLNVGDSITLSATVKPENAFNKTITWSTSNENVVVVDQGKVTAIGVGSAKVIAQIGKVKAECIVNVTPIEINSIILDQVSVSLLPGDSIIVKATISPENATNQSLEWSYSNQNIAKVNNGTIYAISVGNAVITAKSGNVSAQCAVKVMPINVSSIKLDKSSLNLSIGQSSTLIATVFPENATNKTLTWKSSNSYVATVDNGKVIAKQIGFTKITAEIDNIYAECSVFVLPTNISFKENVITMSSGERKDLISYLIPSSTPSGAITWSSSNVEVISMENGFAVANTEGKSVITAKCSNGAFATCNIIVIDSPDSGGSEGTNEIEW